MKVKTYKNRSLQDALENIKQELGSEALILNTKSVKVRPPFSLFKRPAWEVTAALEEKPLTGELIPSPAASRRPLPDGEGLYAELGPLPRVEPGPREARARQGEASSKSSVRVASSTSAAAVAPAVESPKGIVQRDHRMDELIGQIADLKRSLRTLTKAIPSKSQDFGGGLYAEIVSLGIDHDLADRLLTTAAKGKPAPSELRERVRRLLGDQVVIAPPAELAAKTRVVSVLVGPTGVGKTTTIAKIAGHAAIRMKKKTALISTDMVRVGGHEQLSRFGELLRVPVYSCADVSTLKDLMASLDDRDLILIDTPGSSPSDLARLSKLETVTTSAQAKVHLVISATTRSEDVAKIVARFQRFSPASVIFTKIDETDAKGAFVGDLMRHELAVSYLTNGQRVPEDLLLPSAHELSRYVLPLEPAI